MPKSFFFLILGILTLSWALHCPSAAQAQKPVSIAVIGPMSGKDARSGQAMLDGVRLQVKQINAQGGLQGREIRLEVYDNKHDKALARKQARIIAKHTQCVAVIGHYYSSLSLEGGRIYRQAGIPAVTGSATAPAVTEGNDWYFRVISDNRLQGRLSALYLSGVLDLEPVSIVYEKDAYGRTLSRSFQSAASKLGLDIESVWGIDSLKDNVPRKLEAFCAHLETKPRPQALYLAMLDQEAAALIRKLRKRGLDIPILGGDSLGLGTFPKEVASHLQKPETVGDYTHGIYATTYFIRDIANQKAQRFSRAFINEYGHEPDALSATNYDAAGILLKALSRVDLNKETSRVRRRIQEALQHFSSPGGRGQGPGGRGQGAGTAYTGVTGSIYFDAQGNAVNPSPLGLYVRDTLVSAPVQLTPVLKPNRILDVQKRLASGDLLFFEDTLYYKTDVVYTGLDMNEILHIDQKN